MSEVKYECKDVDSLCLTCKDQEECDFFLSSSAAKSRMGDKEIKIHFVTWYCSERLGLQGKCKQCGEYLSSKDMANSLYGTIYKLCRKCASKISV